MKPERIKLTAKQRYDASIVLNQHCRTIDGVSVYDAGWDDKTVAMAAGITHPNGAKCVGYMREKIFGPLSRPKTLADENSDRLAVIESDIRRILDRIGNLEDALISLDQKRKTTSSRVSRIMSAHNALCRHLIALDPVVAQFEVITLLKEKSDGQS